MPLTTKELTLPALRAAYAAGNLSPTEVCCQLLPAVAASQAVFIARPKDEEVLERCRSGRADRVCRGLRCFSGSLRLPTGCVSAALWGCVSLPEQYAVRP